MAIVQEQLRSIHHDPGMAPRVKVFSASITALDLSEFTELLTGWAKGSGNGRMVCVANVHMLVEARRDASVAAILGRADAVSPDGMPVVWCMRRFGYPNQQRVAGMDLLPELCAAAEMKSIRVYFLGSTPAVLSAIRDRLNREHPHLEVVGMEAPPFREMTAEEETSLVKRINRARPGFLFVALGCPKQERWMDRNVVRVNAVMVGLGAAFPVYAGTLRRAPAPMQRHGLEWFYRLSQEPKRLWRRYLTTNTYFLLWLIRAWWTRESRSRPPELLKAERNASNSRLRRWQSNQ